MVLHFPALHKLGLATKPGWAWFLHLVRLISSPGSLVSSPGTLVSSPGSPGFFTWEKPAGNLCCMKMPKNTFAPAVQQCEIFFSPRMIACEGLTELTQCPLEGRLSVVCGRYELSLRICTGRGFAVTIVTPAA